MEKKAVSPIVATVLLIMIVIILAIIILVWMQGFIGEAVMKEIAGKEKSAEQYCSEVSLTPFINNDGSFGFRNTGNVPIFSVNVKLYPLSSPGSSEIVKIEKDQGGMVNPGFATTLKDPNTGLEFSYDDYEKVEIIPILLGKTEKGGTQQFTCPETSAVEI